MPVEILYDDGQRSFTPKEQEIRSCIDGSDILIYLLDLESFIGCKDHSDEHAWMFREFLTRQVWKKKHRLVVISKADIYTEMLAKKDGNLKDISIEALPKSFTNKLLVKAATAVDFVALTSVKITTVISDDGSPKRVPQKPLEPGDMGDLLSFLLQMVNRRRWFRR